jgi:hypothetical protein
MGSTSAAVHQFAPAGRSFAGKEKYLMKAGMAAATRRQPDLPNDPFVIQAPSALVVSSNKSSTSKRRGMSRCCTQ